MPVTMTSAICNLSLYLRYRQHPLGEQNRLVHELGVATAVGLAKPVFTVEGDYLGVYLGCLALKRRLEFC